MVTELSPEIRDYKHHYKLNGQLNRLPIGTLMRTESDYGKHGFEFEDFTRSVLIINSSYLEQIDSITKAELRM